LLKITIQLTLENFRQPYGGGTEGGEGGGSGGSGGGGEQVDILKCQFVLNLVENNYSAEL